MAETRPPSSKNLVTTEWLAARLGEPEVQFWHEVDAGYAGRQPLSPSLVG